VDSRAPGRTTGLSKAERSRIETTLAKSAGAGEPLPWARPVSRTLSEQVTEMILSRIASGDLLPGASLPPQRELAEELGVALSVVREAIQRLQVLRVVQTRHGSGTVVQSLTWSQIAGEPSLRILAFEPRILKDVWEARYAIEKETTQLAAQRATDDDLRAIHEALKAGEPAPETFERNLLLNTAFHLAIARAAKNNILVDLLKPLLDVGFTSIPEVFDRGAADLAWDAHRRLFAAISKHDPEATGKALAYHMSSANVEVEKVRTLWGRRSSRARNMS
jgi:GntR family transcriptional repressor for pyruvate dehydrogenase complex